jgi:hypothetical protein
MKKAFFERIELSRRSFLFGVELMRWFLKTYFVLSMLRQIFFISLLSLFIAPLGATEVLRLTAAEPVPVFRWNKVNFSYCSGELPAAVVMAKTMALSRRDMKWLETTFKNKQPASVVAGPGFRFARQFLFALKKRESQALLFEYPSDASKSFVVQITYNVTQDELCESSPKAPWTDVTIYASSEKIPKHVLEFVKTCVLQRGWFRLNQYKAMTCLGIVAVYVAVRCHQAYRTNTIIGITKQVAMLSQQRDKASIPEEKKNLTDLINQLNDLQASLMPKTQDGAVDCYICGASFLDELLLQRCSACTAVLDACSDKVLCKLCSDRLPNKNQCAFCRQCVAIPYFVPYCAPCCKVAITNNTCPTCKKVFSMGESSVVVALLHKFLGPENLPWAVGGALALAAAHFADLRSN